jgi:hypothetical protein
VIIAWKVLLSFDIDGDDFYDQFIYVKQYLNPEKLAE